VYDLGDRGTEIRKKLCSCWAVAGFIVICHGGCDTIFW